MIGKWNKYVLNPNWAAKNLFLQDSLDVSFPLSLDAPLFYTSKNIKFEPSDERVRLMAETVSDEVLLAIEEIGCKILHLLTYTPMRAVGINFGFVEKNKPELFSLFRITDQAEVSKDGAEIINTTISRKIIVEGGPLNFKISQLSDGVLFDFNFHYDVKDATEAQGTIKGKILNYKAIAEKFLNSTYKLEYDKEEPSNG